MAHWTLQDIPWHTFNAAAVNPKHLALLKAACMVEHNANDYAEYLRNVFKGDSKFCEETVDWAAEETQHGMALRRWVEMADPTFQFDESFSMFTDGYQLPMNVDASVRGSRCGELIARCVVETGTSTYYTALMEDSDEPVLKAICAKIAADEYRHYQLFYRYLKQYGGDLKLWERFRIAVSRIAEIEDDELAFAFHSAHDPEPGNYNQKRATATYYQHLAEVYRPHHIARMCAMVLRAVGLKPNGKLHHLASRIAWKAWKWRAHPPAWISDAPFAIA